MALSCLSLPAVCCTSASAAAVGLASSRLSAKRMQPMLVSLPYRRNAAFGQIVCMAPEEEKLTRRNPLDFPIVSVLLLSFTLLSFIYFYFIWKIGQIFCFYFSR